MATTSSASASCKEKSGDTESGAASQKRKFKVLDEELVSLRSKAAMVQGGKGAQASRRAAVLNSKADDLEP